MNDNKTPKGQIEVTFYDNTKIAATIYHRAENVVLCWTNSGGGPLEHPVQPKKQQPHLRLGTRIEPRFWQAQQNV